MNNKKDLSAMLGASHMTLSLLGHEFEMRPMNLADHEEFGDEFEEARTLIAAGQTRSSKVFRYLARMTWVLIRRSGLTIEQAAKKEWAISLEEVQQAIDDDNAMEVGEKIRNFFEMRQKSAERKTSEPETKPSKQQELIPSST